MSPSASVIARQKFARREGMWLTGKSFGFGMARGVVSGVCVYIVPGPRACLQSHFGKGRTARARAETAPEVVGSSSGKSRTVQEFLITTQEKGTPML